MKLHLYQQQYSIVFLKCSLVVRDMHYTIHHEDLNLGIMSAFQNDMQMKIIDLKFSIEDDMIRITVVSGLITNDFKNISYDELTAHEFSDKLFNLINYQSHDNSFRLTPEDYLIS